MTAGTIYLLRDLAADEIPAVLEGRPMREVIIDLLDQWATTVGLWIA